MKKIKVNLLLKVILLILLSSNHIHYVTGELFTALVHLEKLLKTEKHLIGALNSYLSSEEQRLNQLKHVINHYESAAINFQHDNNEQRNNEDVETYLSNPINAYLLVKRLTTDWQTVESIINDKSEVNSIKMLMENETFPSQEDLSGAAEAVIRLQDTYKLDTSSLADGVIPIRDKRNDYDDTINQRSKLQAPHHRTVLTANDCFELGRQAYLNKDYYHTVLWMQEALERLDKELDNEKTAYKDVILEHLAYATYLQGNVRHALKLTRELLRISPDHSRAKGNIEYYEKELSDSTKKKRGDDGDVPHDDSITESEKTWNQEESEKETYEALCRGERKMSVKTESQLLCFHLNTTYIPYLRLTRVKVEEAYKKPQIVIFHDFLSAKEIDVIKSLAEPKLNRATVQNSVTGKLETAKYRISKSAWLTNNDHQVVNRITKRVQATTGLEMSTAEELQVVNYGIGGHYEPHYDFARKREKNAFSSLGTGNRIATWLNYMSDVEAGGATVFPLLGVTIWPKKGSAAFWYNLHRSGDGDLLTRHAACPVLVGSKWVSNKWIHERGQEFRRPCGLKINQYNLVQQL